jgi:hypothetical protein
VSEYEILHDPATGEPLASVCLRAPITDDERATLVEYFLWLRDHKRAASIPSESRSNP